MIIATIDPDIKIYKTSHLIALFPTDLLSLFIYAIHYPSFGDTFQNSYTK